MMKNCINRRNRVTPLIQSLQSLESRRLLSFSVSPDSAVIMNTSLGEVTVQLYSDTPITKANFLSYVNANAYNGTVFHRIAVNGETQIGGTTETYGVVQGGGYIYANGTFNPISSNPPIINEATDAHPNSIGTIAMARSSSPDSATSQFFFNTTDNSPIFDPEQGSAGYAVFGNVIRGMGVVDTINNLNPQTVAGFENVPETSAGSFVTINSAVEEDTMTVTLGAHDAQGDRTVTFVDPTTRATTKISLANADATLTFTGTHLAAQRNGPKLTVTGTSLQLQNITSADATTKSSLNISTSGGQRYATIGDIDITGSMNALNAPGVNLSGDITVSGGLKTLKLKATTSAGTIVIDSSSITKPSATNIDIPNLSDVSIVSNAPIQSLSTHQYVIDDGTSRGVSAPTISKITATNKVDATIEANSIPSFKAGNLTGILEANTIGSVTVNKITGGIIYGAAAYNAKTLGIAKVKVAASITNGQIVAAGNIGTVQAESISDSDILAGIDTSDLQSSNFPSALAANANLKSFTLTGKGRVVFSNSQIAAYTIGALKLGEVSTLASSGVTMGIQSHDIQSLVATTDKKQSLNLSNINSQAKVTVDTANLVLEDFKIEVI